MKVAEGERRNPEFKGEDDNLVSSQTTQNQISLNGQPSFKRLGPRARIMEQSPNVTVNAKNKKCGTENNIPFNQINI